MYLQETLSGHSEMAQEILRSKRSITSVLMLESLAPQSNPRHFLKVGQEFLFITLAASCSSTMSMVKF